MIVLNVDLSHSEQTQDRIDLDFLYFSNADDTRRYKSS